MKKLYLLLILITLIFSFNYSVSAIQNEKAKAISKTFLNLLQKKQFKKATTSFDSIMSKQFNHEQLRQVWTQLSMSLGEVKKIDESYIGKNANGIIEVITPLHFSSTSLDAKIYVRNNQITGFFVSQHISREYIYPEYVDTTKFKEMDLIVNENGEYPLNAKLTIPVNEEDNPVLILVHGSGPNDMDQTVGPNKIFKDIAYGLASQGIAVLRYEKRTFAYPGKMAEMLDSLTLEQETVDDAVHAFELLKKQKMIDPEKIFILGHSLGGYAIPIIAERTNAAGYIMSAAPARNLEIVVSDQYDHIFGYDGKIDENEQKYIDEYNLKLTNLEKLKNGTYLKDSTKLELPLNMSEKYWRYLNDYRLLEKALNINKPLLLIHNSRDYQVTDKDLKIWEETLKGDNFKIVVLEGLNHLFIEGEGLSAPEEYNKKGSVDRMAIDLIKNWIKSN
jgi:hypothetical protein